MTIEKHRESMLLESLKDLQSTIRGLDVKAGFLFVFLCVPFGKMGEITPAFVRLIQTNALFTLAIIIFFLIWGFALFVLFMGLSPQNNPSDSVDFNGINNHPKGFLYGGYLLKPLSFSKILSSAALPNQKNSLNDEILFLNNLSEYDYLSELIYERMKLVTIRNIKLQRISICIKAIFIWIIIAACLWISYLVVKV